MDLQRSFASAWRFKKLFTFVFFDLVGAEYCTARDHVKCEPQNRICVLCWMWVSVSVDNTQRPILTDCERYFSVTFFSCAETRGLQLLTVGLQGVHVAARCLLTISAQNQERLPMGFCIMTLNRWSLAFLFFLFFFFNLLGKKYTIDTLSPKSLYLLFTSWCSY